MTLPGRAAQLDQLLASLLRRSPEVEAAAVVSFDGLPMASALPEHMDEARVAAMSAALLSLGERAAEGLGRGGLTQVYIEGVDGTVFLVSADGEAVLVAVAAADAKAGLVLYELRRSAVTIGELLRAELDGEGAEEPAPAPAEAEAPAEAAAPVAAYAAGYPAEDPAAGGPANGFGSLPAPNLLPDWSKQSSGDGEAPHPNWS